MDENNMQGTTGDDNFGQQTQSDRDAQLNSIEDGTRFKKQQNLVRAFFEDVLTLLEKSHAANAGEVAKMRERLPEIFD